MTGVGIIGGGTMGFGITYAFVTAGYRTTVVEPDADRAGTIRAELARRAEAGLARGRLDPARAAAADELLTISGAIEELPRGLDVVIESVPERAAAKAEVLAAAERTGPALLASNTSALSIDELATGLTRPEAFLGMHFFNPVWSIPLVEIVRGQASAEQAMTAARALVAGIGKEPIEVRDSPGFITSRLDNATAFEAMRMLDDGIATAADIDRAAVLAYGHPIGPLRLSDVVGLDVRVDIARHLRVELGERFAPPGILQAKVRRGELGRKSGRGFFGWTD
jgi:3-hydroxybutyryl-CoA dehydrogenase